MIHRAIGNRRPIVLSPGPAKIAEAQFYAGNANMWRITDDFWDTWPLLKDMFRRCELWRGKTAPGCYPDCDMLPVGKIGGCFGEKTERDSGFTKDEQITMMTLWCIFGAPLMIGAKLPGMDEFTLKLLTNSDVLHLLRNGRGARQLVRNEEEAVWTAYDAGNDCGYLAMFNLSDEERAIHCWTGVCADLGYRAYTGGPIREIWGAEGASFSGGGLACLVPAHGVRIFIY